jgi:hypothetical protein
LTLPTIQQVEFPQAQGFDAQLDDLLLRLFVGPRTPIQREAAPAQANRVNTSVDREEFVSDFGEVFGRSDFTGGEGLDWAHRPNQGPRDRQRYWDAQGIDVGRPEPGRRRQLSLLRDVDQILESADVAPHMVAIGDTLFVTDGTQIQVGLDALGVTGWAAEDPNVAEGAQTVHMLAVFGDQLFAALGANGVHIRSSAGVWSHYSNLAAVGVWVAKGRLFVSTGRALFEVSDADPNPAVALRTLAPGHAWVDVVDAGEIVGAGDDGYLYTWTVDELGALALAHQTLIQHEIPTCLGESQGQVFVGTRQGALGRLWKGGLSDGQFAGEVVREWDNGAPTSIVADREQVYTTVVAGGETHAWRYDVVEGGLFRHFVYPAAGDTSLAVVDGTLFAAIDAAGVWRPAVEFVADGWLIGPLADFFSADIKLWVGAQIDAGLIPAGTSVELWYTTDPAGLSSPDHASWVRVRTLSSESEPTVEAPLASVEARALAGMIRLYATPARDAAPVVHAFGFRAYPSKSDVILTLPVNVSDVVALPGRAAIRVPGRGAEVQAALEAREGTATLLQVFRPPVVLRESSSRSAPRFWGCRAAVR